jgi:hypothetical protein
VRGSPIFSRAFVSGQVSGASSLLLRDDDGGGDDDGYLSVPFYFSFLYECYC